MLLLLLWLLGPGPGPGARVRVRAQHCDESPLEIQGEAVLTALLPLRAGPGCEAGAGAGAANPSPPSLNPRGLRQAVAAVQVLSALPRLHPTPVDIGLRIVDSCNSPDVARKTLLATLAQLDCLHLYSLGVLLGAEVARSRPVAGLSSGLGQALWPLPESRAPEPELGSATASLLAAGAWPAADVLTSSVHDDEGDDDPDGDSEHHLDAAEVLADAVVEAARLRSVCTRRGHSPDGFQWSGPPTRALVLCGIEAALRRMLREHVLTQVDADSPRPQLLLVPPDGVWAGTPLPRGALLLLPDTAPLHALLGELLDANGSLSERPDSEEVAARAGLDELLDVGRAVLQASDLLRAGVDALCADGGAGDSVTPEAPENASLPEVPEVPEVPFPAAGGLCSRLPPAGLLRAELAGTGAGGTEGAGLELEELLELLELRPEEVQARAASSAAFTLLRSPGPGRPLLPVARFRDARWTFLDDGVVHQPAADPVDCPSLLADSQVEWVREAWVATLLTVAALGTLCAAAVAFFITSRILAGDVLEGSATLSLLLLLGVLVSYASALPYCLRGAGQGQGALLCALRLLAAPLAHALLLGVMLARALMLAACDHDGGLLSHVSGPLQAALCFFTISVQVAQSVLLGLVMSPSLCASLSGLRLLALLAYDGLLLLLLALTTPFIFTSRRNYREGGFFAVTTGALLVAWSCWLTLFLVGGHAWRDVALGSGLAASATLVLLGVFIPRTYMMAGAIVRDKLAAQLPALARDVNITDLTFREVAAGGLHAGANLYADRPSTPLTPDNTYARYEVPSPLKVTRF